MMMWHLLFVLIDSTTDENWRRHSISTFCRYLYVVLRRIVAESVCIQLHFAENRAFKSVSASIKTTFAENRKAAKTGFKQILKVPKMLKEDPRYHTMHPDTVAHKLSALSRISKKRSQRTVDIGVHKLKYGMAHSLYDVIIHQVRQFRDAQMLQPKDFSISFAWINEKAQSIIDYIYSSTLKAKNISAALSLDLYPNVPNHFPIAYGVLVIEHLALLAIKLNLSEFNSFIHHQIDYDNQTMIRTKFGIFVNDTISQQIEYSNEMRAIHKLISFVDGANCIVTSDKIECITKMHPFELCDHWGTNQQILFRGRDEWNDKIENLLHSLYAVNESVPNWNFTEHIFNSSCLVTMDKKSLTQISLHSFNYNTMMMMGRMKEKFAASNNIFSAKQNEKYLEQMNNYIEFLRETTKELSKTNNTLHLRIGEIRRQSKALVGLPSLKLLDAFHVHQSKINLIKHVQWISGTRNQILLIHKELKNSELFSRSHWKRKLKY